MTVTKGKRTYSFPVNSGNTSDVESLHLGSVSASDTESVHNEPSRSRPVASKPFADAPTLSKHSGRKKIRRFQNRCLLQTLAEEEEEDDVVIMQPYDSPFSKLLHDEGALQFWNEFVDKSEEEQADVIAAFSRNKKETRVQKQKPFSRISSKIKRTIKIRKNLSLEQIKESEDDLLAFFKTTPSQTYVKFPPTYFERMLLIACAQYHGLQALGIVEDGNKRVEIYNTVEGWIPAECFLTGFIAQLRK